MLEPQLGLRRAPQPTGAAARSLLPEAPVVADHGLHRSRCRDRHQGAEDAQQRGADQDRHDHDQRVKLDGAPVHERLDQVVLDLLVEDQHRRPDDQPDREVDERDHDPDQDPAERGADQGDQVEEPEQDRQREREGHVEDPQRHVGHQPGQDADHEVAEHVAGDRVRDVVGDRPQPPGPLRRHLSVEELEQAVSVLDQEEGDHEDREELHEAGEDADGDVPQGAGGVAELAGQLLRLLGQLLGDLVAVVVVAEGLVVCAGRRRIRADRRTGPRRR